MGTRVLTSSIQELWTNGSFRSGKLVASVLAVALLVLSKVILSLGPVEAHAQAVGEDWSAPVLLTEFRNDEFGFHQPVIVADRTGKVFVFWNQWNQVAQGRDGEAVRLPSIYSSYWDGKSWSRPVDVVGAYAFLSSGTVDNGGMLHLLWSGFGNRLYYGRATAANAGSARGWTEVPVALGYGHGQIAVDSRSRLHLVYGGLESRGPYYQQSDDGGDTWSLPVNISGTSSDNGAADWVRIAVSENGTIHAVWTEFRLPQGWPPLGVFYSRSNDQGRTWSKAHEIAGFGYDDINVAVVGDNMVHAAWNGMASITGRYHRWSTDGGTSWSPEELVVPGGGTEESPQLAVDSEGVLHLLTTSGMRVWYASWEDGRWTAPAYVPSGDEAGVPPLGSPVDDATRDIEDAAMTIGMGNRLHAVFWDKRDPQGLTRVWYSTRITLAPAAPPIAGPASAATTSGMVKPSMHNPIDAVAPIEREFSAMELAPPADPATLPPLPSPRSTAFSGVWGATLMVAGLLFFGVVRNRSR